MSGVLGEIPDWARRCPSGKQKFASAEDARRIYRTDPYRSSFKGTMHVYRCQDCDSFHYTSTARQRNKRKHRSDWRDAA